IEILIPEAFRKNHHSHVSTGFSQKTARLMADGRGLTAQHKDGHEIEMSIGLAHFTIGMQPHMLCVCIRKEDSLATDTITEPTLRGLFNEFDINSAVTQFATTRGQGMLREDEIITANGAVVPVEFSGALMAKSSENPTGAIVTVRDISERKIAETAKAEFLATVSHELRTPLTSIKGALGLIKSGAVGDLNDKLSHLVSVALSNSDRLIFMVNDILDIEKNSAGKMEFKLEPMDMCELVHKAIEANHGYAKTHGVAFKYNGPDKKILVKGDMGRLMQVMSNLMSNAAKFSKKGQDIEISLKCIKDKVRVQVKDSGSGIPEAAQATIFDKFTQADSSDQRQTSGTGLGLSIVKIMVEAHGGKIAFDSVEGKGTTFYFDLDLLV
ncbi:MAG: PAS domain-containing sensor histidine kinase, partial [Rhodobacterales bacterium]